LPPTVAAAPPLMEAVASEVSIDSTVVVGDSEPCELVPSISVPPPMPEVALASVGTSSMAATGGGDTTAEAAAAEV